MLLQIVIKEIQEHLKSLRLLLTCLLLIALMVVSAVFFISEYQQQMADFSRNRNETLERLSQYASRPVALIWVFSYNWDGPWIYKTPNHLNFVSEGHDRDLPNAFSPSAFKIYGPTKRIRTNVLLWRSEALDWGIIIGIILSFAALILVYDAVCGERELGTLRLNLANSVSKSTLILAKFIGGLISLALALLLGILLHLIILIGFGNIPFRGVDWGIIGLVCLLAVLYISAFLMLGLFISSRVKESATSLVVSLLCWALLVVVIPGLGGLISSRMTSLPTSEEVFRDANRAERETLVSYNKKNPEMEGSSYSGHWSPGEPLERALVGSDAWSKVFDSYRNQMIYQVEIAQKVTLVSPTACFQYGLETLVESGIFHYKRFFEQVQDYRLAMRQFLIDNYPLPLKWHAWNESIPEEERRIGRRKIEAITLDFDSIPKFEDKQTGMRKLVVRALPYFLLLFLFNALFFMGAYVSFIRYDVR